MHQKWKIIFPLPSSHRQKTEQIVYLQSAYSLLLYTSIANQFSLTLFFLKKNKIKQNKISVFHMSHSQRSYLSPITPFQYIIQEPSTFLLLWITFPYISSTQSYNNIIILPSLILCSRNCFQEIITQEVCIRKCLVKWIFREGLKQQPVTSVEPASRIV